MGNFFSILENAYSNAYSNQFKLKLDKKYIAPKIYHGGANYDLKKRWYVYYSFAHPKELNKSGLPKMVRQPPITLSINRKYKTKSERLFHFTLIKEVLLDMLKEGFSPYETELNINLETNEYTSEVALDFAFSLKVDSKLADSTISDYRSRYEQFKDFLKKKNLLDRNISHVDKKTVNEFLNSVLRNSSARNRNNSRQVLSSLFGTLEDNDIIERNFFNNIKVLKTSSQSHKTYSLEHLEGLFNYMKVNDPLLLLFIKIVSFNFLRPIEVCRLKISDILLPEKRIFFKAKNKKGGKTKIIPDIVAKELQAYDFNNPNHFLFTPTGIGSEWDSKEKSRRGYFTKRFRKLKAKYNIFLKEQGKSYSLGDEYTIYSFRHTFITILYRAFREIYTQTETYDKLMLITGHSTLKALKEYLKDIDAELPEDYSGLIVQNLFLK